MCQRCNDVGYLSIRNGDDSVDCPVCGDTSTPELGVTKAAEEPISPLAQIRLQVDSCWEAIERKLDDDEFDNRLDVLKSDSISKFRLLFYHIDQQAKELDALRAQVAALEAANDKREKERKAALYQSAFGSR